MPTYAIGDVHGQLEKLTHLLEGAGLTDAEGHWSGANSRLWFMGDLFDRGPGGIGVCDLVMRLEAEAALEGGFVGCLMGNHEPLILPRPAPSSGTPPGRYAWPALRAFPMSG